MGLKRKVKVKMSCTAYVIVDEDVQGNMDIEDVEGIEDIEDFEVINTDWGGFWNEYDFRTGKRIEKLWENF